MAPRARVSRCVHPIAFPDDRPLPFPVCALPGRSTGTSAGATGFGPGDADPRYRWRRRPARRRLAAIPGSDARVVRPVRPDQRWRPTIQLGRRSREGSAARCGPRPRGLERRPGDGKEPWCLGARGSGGGGERRPAVGGRRGEGGGGSGRITPRAARGRAGAASAAGGCGAERLRDRPRPGAWTKEGEVAAGLASMARTQGQPETGLAQVAARLERRSGSRWEAPVTSRDVPAAGVTGSGSGRFYSGVSADRPAGSGAPWRGHRVGPPAFPGLALHPRRSTQRHHGPGAPRSRPVRWPLCDGPRHPEGSRWQSGEAGRWRPPGWPIVDWPRYRGAHAVGHGAGAAWTPANVAPPFRVALRWAAGWKACPTGIANGIRKGGDQPAGHWST
jgi:hypothetical protein